MYTDQLRPTLAASHTVKAHTTLFLTHYVYTHRTHNYAEKLARNTLSSRAMCVR